MVQVVDKADGNILGSGTSEEPFLVADDENEDWLLSLMRKPKGLPSPSKIKNDPWSALDGVNSDTAGKN